MDPFTHSDTRRTGIRPRRIRKPVMLGLLLTITFLFAGCGSLLRFDGQYRTHDITWRETGKSYPLITEIPAIDGTIDCVEDLTRKGSAKVGVELNWRNRDDFAEIFDAYAQRLIEAGFEEYDDPYRDEDDPYERAFNRESGTTPDGSRRFLHVSLNGFPTMYEGSYNMYMSVSYSDLSRLDDNRTEAGKTGSATGQAADGNEKD